MSSRGEINSMLKEAKYDELVARALADRSVIKYLFQPLYHPYGTGRWRAIKGLGHVGRELAKTDPGAARELIRRLLWSMNDESGTTGWSAPEAIGEIIYHNPEMFQEFIPIVVHASEEEIFHRGIAWTLGRLGQIRPEMVREFIPLLVKFLSHPRAEVRGYAAWSLGQMGAGEALFGIENLLEDASQFEVYDGQEITMKGVNQLAREAISKNRS